MGLPWLAWAEETTKFTRENVTDCSSLTCTSALGWGPELPTLEEGYRQLTMDFQASLYVRRPMVFTSTRRFFWTIRATATMFAKNASWATLIYSVYISTAAHSKDERT